MTIEDLVKKFYRAIAYDKALVVENTEDQNYYIDFSKVRGGEIIKKLKTKIAYLEDMPTCQLFTGHVGCGKSTELLRLKKELQEEGFHVVYFESDQDLEVVDVDIIDVLLAIAKRVSQSLEKIVFEEPTRLKELLQRTVRVLNSEVTGMKFKIPGFEVGGYKVPAVGDVGVSTDKEKFSLAFGIGEITTTMKNDATLRDKINQYLGPQKTQLLDAINKELLEPAIAKLKEQGKKGLVAIVDNLDRLNNTQKPSGRPQQEYLFIDQGEFLKKLNCHLVYTMPLALNFSSERGMLTERFDEPWVLPMVPVQLQDGSEHKDGMALLRQMVLARAFPDLKEQKRLDAIPQIFDSPESLDRLCRASGGHVRDLLKLLNRWIMEEMSFPLCRESLEMVIRASRNEMILSMQDDKWELLRQVRLRKKIGGDREYQTLIATRLVFEYRDRGEVWFEINPILAEAKELQP